MSVDIHCPSLAKMFDKQHRRERLEQYSMKVAEVMRKYVPRDENILRRSEPVNSRYAEGLLIWNTPYAAAQYYKRMNHTTPGTTDHWDEEVRNNDMPELRDFVAGLYGGI